MNLNGAYQLLVCVLIIYFERSVQTIKENIQYLVFVRKEIGLEIYANKTKNMIIHQDQDAGRIDNIKIENSSSGIMYDFKYLGTACILQEDLLTLRQHLAELYL